MRKAPHESRSSRSPLPPPDDLDDEPSWAADPITPKEALERFDALDPVDPGDLTGLWRGRSLPTGHPMDGLLESLGWYGKAFEASGRVHPLLFRRPSGTVIALEPAFMPTWVALTWPAVARHPAVRSAFLAAGPALQARGPSGRLETQVFRGRSSAALVYDRQPIVDHIRRLEGDRMLGLMTRAGMKQPFFFVLTRETERIRLSAPDIGTNAS